MRKSSCYLAAWLMAVLFSFAANAQTVTVSGTVRNESSKENVPSVSVRVKGTEQGTYTNPNGEFSLRVAKLPVVLVFTSIGYEDQEVTVSDASMPVSVDFKINNALGQEVVIAATRAPQRILESPVTVERMSSATIRSNPGATYYEGLANLKGVDVHTASLTFRTITTRGFVSSGNTRLNQLVDGMDNQSPGLNFSVSSIVGLTEQDVDNIEVLSGASSALYGSGGMNGTVLITSKNPFKYQGLSYNIKQGIMHVDGKQRNAAPYYNWSFRYAKAINNKWAFKFTGELTKGSDWQADDYRNKKLDVDGLFGVAGGNRQNTTDFNGINTYGDEVSVNMDAFASFVEDQVRTGVLRATGNFIDLVALQNFYYNAIGNPVYPTAAQIAGFSTYTGYPVSPAQLPLLLGTLQSSGIAAQTATMFPFYNGRRNGYFKGASLTRTGYNERDLVDYNTLNVKFTGGLHWKITDKIEASWNTYFGTGTTVYTGANRYSLRNFKLAQHKLEFKATNWLVRAYTTQENAGDSYIGDAVGSFMNEAARPSATVWFPTYIGTFSEVRRNMGLGTPLPPPFGPAPGGAVVQSDITLHNALRNLLDFGTIHPLTGAAIPGSPRFEPGTTQFIAAAKQIKSTPVNKAGGSKFLDKSDMYAAEGQLNLSDALHFSDKVEVIVGAQWKQWALNSKGTIFADTAGIVRVNETGGYIQLKKKFLNDILTLTASGRYDKQTNFEGKFTPRFAAVIRVAKDNNIRLSYQSSYRFPVNQDQYISLRLGGGTNFLIGSLPEFQDFYKLNSTLTSPRTSPGPGYSIASVLNYRKKGGSIADSALLQVAQYKPISPETVKAYELGYKGIIGKKLLLDAYVYYSVYDNFLVNQTVVQSQTGPQREVYSTFSSNSLTYRQNSDQKIKSTGWGIGMEYKIYKTYMLYGNVFSDELRDVPENTATFFNAPKYRFNIGLRNDNVCHNIGFNAIVKWQDNNDYEGTFVKGKLPYFASVDAQVTYKPKNTKSTFRVGGTNWGNNYYRTGYGSPAVGGLYYISYGYNL